MLDPNKNRLGFHPLGLYPPRYVQPIKHPLLALMNKQERDAFFKRAAAEEEGAQKKDGPISTQIKEQSTLKTGLLWQLAHHAFKKDDPKTEGQKSKASSGVQTPSEIDDQELAEQLSNLPTSELLELLKSKFSPLPSEADHTEASRDSFVHLSKASSITGDHDVRSLPDTASHTPASFTSPLLSRATSHLKLPTTGLEYPPRHDIRNILKKHEDDEDIEQSTATLKP